MYAVERLGCYITRGVYTVSVPFHSLGGAVDVIVVEQPDGSCKSSPWYVRLGKFQGALKPKEKVVYVSVNGVEADFNMYLDHKGEAYFLRDVDNDDDDDDDEESVRSSSSDETDGLPRDRRRKFQSKSCNYDATSSGAEGEIEIPRGKSFGLFGRTSMKNNPNPDEKSGYGIGRADSLERAEIAANLLEVKWATNLATRKKDSRLMYSSFKNFKEKADRNMHNSDDKTLMSSSMEDNCDSHDDDKGNQNAWSGYNNSESVFRETSTSSTSLSSNDQSFEYSVSDDELLEEKCEMKYKIQMKIDEGTLETMQCSGSEKGIILETTYRDELIMPEQLSCIDINNENVEAITRKSPSVLESIGDRVSPKVFNMPPPVNSDEKQLQLCAEFQRLEPTYQHCGNFESYPSSESLDKKNLTALDQENLTEVHKSSVNGSTFPIMISKGHNVRNAKATRMVKSLPNMRTRTGEIFLNDHISHSLDSNPISRKLTRSEKSKTSFETKGDKEQHPVVESHASELLDDACGNLSEAIVSPSESRKIWPFSSRNSRSMKNLNLCQDLRKMDGENVTEEIMNVDQGSKILQKKSGKKKTRAMTPTSEQLESLNLKEGRNTVSFWFSTPSLGKKQVDARIFLWKWNTRIVISDVDGTITKSDVLGQFMPLVGIDWSQTGVTHLFSAIKENGYQILFLSARSISQAYLTRQFLINLKQDGKTLPEGPVIISPDGLLPSLYREVIRRAPHEFKIACLEKIRELFPADSNPFYAGFGNRDTDEMSYVKVGVPRGKIFIINPKGEVAVNHRVDTKSYTSYHTLVNDMFPLTTSFEQEDYNSWNFWKLPLPVLEN